MSRKCPVSLFLAARSLPLHLLLPRTPLTLTSNHLSSFLFVSECPFRGTQEVVTVSVSASDPHAECACRLVLPHTNLPLNYTFAGQSRPVCPNHLHWISRATCCQLLGVFHSVESKQLQRESGLHRPDVTGLSKTLWRFSVSYTLRFWATQPAIQPTHTKLKFTGPKAPGAATRGWFMCLCVPEPLRGQVCVYVCVGGSRALGTESGSLLTTTVAATLATQEGKCVEWVSGRGMYSSCLCDCVYKFKHLNSINTTYGTWYTPAWMVVFLALWSFWFSFTGNNSKTQ